MAAALCGYLALTAVDAGAVTHVVDQSGLGFVPADLTIQVGDVVQWVWNDGLHTVTSGSSLSDPALGSLFDAPLNSANPTFSHTFAAAGEVPYLCRPHAGLGMVGIVRVLTPTGVGGGAPVSAPMLLQNAPNPFNPLTRISFEVPGDAAAVPVSLRVFDLRGRWVTTLVDALLPSGPHEFRWDGRSAAGADAPSGAYVCRLVAGGQARTRVMTLAR